MTDRRTVRITLTVETNRPDHELLRLDYAEAKSVPASWWIAPEETSEPLDDEDPLDRVQFLRDVQVEEVQ